MFGRGSVAASFVLIIVSNWARTPATIPQMLGRGSVAASFVVFNGSATIPQMFGRGSVAASFVLIIVSNGQELQQLYHRCLEDQ